MTSGPTGDGLINWLIYLVVGLVSLALGSIQKHFSGRLKKVEDEVDGNRDVCEERLEARRLEIKKDFRLLHEKVDKNHIAVMGAIRKSNGGT